MDFAFTLQMFFVYWKTLSRLWGPGTVYAGQKKKRPKLQTHRIRPSTSIKMDGQVCKFELATVFLFHCLLLLPNILNSFYHGTHKEFIQEVAVLISYFC